MMKKLLVTVLLSIFAVFAVAQDAPPAPWSYGVYYDVPAREASNVVQTSLKYLPKSRVSLNAMAGLTFETKRPVAGFSATRSWSIENDVQVYIGVGVTVSAGNPAGWGPTGGISIRF